MDRRMRAAEAEVHAVVKTVEFRLTHIEIHDDFIRHKLTTGTIYPEPT